MRGHSSPPPSNSNAQPPPEDDFEVRLRVFEFFQATAISCMRSHHTDHKKPAASMGGLTTTPPSSNKTQVTPQIELGECRHVFVPRQTAIRSCTKFSRTSSIWSIDSLLPPVEPCHVGPRNRRLVSFSLAQRRVKPDVLSRLKTWRIVLMSPPPSNPG